MRLWQIPVLVLEMEILENRRNISNHPLALKEGRTPSRFIVEAFGLEIGYDGTAHKTCRLSN